MRKLFKALNPVRFYRESKAFMVGYPRLYFYTRLPIAFVHYATAVLCDYGRDGKV